MEVDVRLIILVMLYVMITAKDDDSKGKITLNLVS